MTTDADSGIDYIEEAESGEWTNGRAVSEDDLLEVLALFDGAEPITTMEARHETGLRYRAVLDRLERLHERGFLDRKEVPEGAVVWWRIAPSCP